MEKPSDDKPRILISDPAYVQIFQDMGLWERLVDNYQVHDISPGAFEKARKEDQRLEYEYQRMKIAHKKMSEFAKKPIKGDTGFNLIAKSYHETLDEVSGDHLKSAAMASLYHGDGDSPTFELGGNSGSELVSGFKGWMDLDGEGQDKTIRDKLDESGGGRRGGMMSSQEKNLRALNRGWTSLAPFEVQDLIDVIARMEQDQVISKEEHTLMRRIGWGIDEEHYDLDGRQIDVSEEIEFAKRRDRDMDSPELEISGKFSEQVQEYQDQIKSEKLSKQRRKDGFRRDLMQKGLGQHRGSDSEVVDEMRQLDKQYAQGKLSIDDVRTMKEWKRKEHEHKLAQRVGGQQQRDWEVIRRLQGLREEQEQETDWLRVDHPDKVARMDKALKDMEKELDSSLLLMEKAMQDLESFTPFSSGSLDRSKSRGEIEMGTKGKRGKHRVGTHRKEVSSGDEVSSSEESVDQDEVEGKKPLRGRKFGMSKHRKKSESSMSLDDM